MTHLQVAAMPRRSGVRGFTLTELVVVIAIIMLLAGLVIGPNLRAARDQAHNVVAQAEHHNQSVDDAEQHIAAILAGRTRGQKAAATISSGELKDLGESGDVIEMPVNNGGASSSPLTPPQLPQLQPFNATVTVSTAAELAAAVGRANAHIKVQPGTYNVKTLHLAKGVQVVGSGWQATRIYCTDGWHVFITSGQNRIADLAIDGRQAAEAVRLAFRSRMPDIAIERVSFYRNRQYAIFGGGERLRIVDCRIGIDGPAISGSSRHHFYLMNTGNTTITGNVFGSTGETSIKNVAEFGDVENVLIQGNQFTGTNGWPPVGMGVNGSWPEARNEQRLKNIAVISNAFSATVKSGAYVEAHNIDGLAVINNHYKVDGASRFLGTSLVSNFTESGNIAVK